MAWAVKAECGPFDESGGALVTPVDKFAFPRPLGSGRLRIPHS